MTSPIESQNPTNAPDDARFADVSQISPPSLFVRVIGSGFFTGYIPIASGTIGSFVGLLFFLIPGFAESSVHLPAIGVMFLIGLRAANAMEKSYGRDPSVVTIDEIVGMWISLAFLPKTIFVITTAFFLFRFFDIVKPYPARRFDEMSGGFGIMMDDVIAGIYANVVIQLLISIPFVKQLI